MQVWSRDGKRQEHIPINSNAVNSGKVAKRGDSTHQRDRRRDRAPANKARPDYQRRDRDPQKPDEIPDDARPNRLAVENMDADIPERPSEESAANLETYSGEELRRMARQLQIHGRSKMSNKELIMAIRGVR